MYVLDPTEVVVGPIIQFGRWWYMKARNRNQKSRADTRQEKWYRERLAMHEDRNVVVCESDCGQWVVRSGELESVGLRREASSSSIAMSSQYRCCVQGVGYYTL